MHRISLILLSVCLISCSIWSCKDETAENPKTDGFDRAALLTNWSDNLILPAFTAYQSKLLELKNKMEAFTQNPDSTGLTALRQKWFEAYMAWQNVSMFEIGKAEALSLRDFSNTFPTSKELIEQNILNKEVNLELPSNRSSQGFPALDYLLNGSATGNSDILKRFQEESGLRDYCNRLTNRLYSLCTEVLTDWDKGYRLQFIENDGSGAISSVNKLVNDFMFYYERWLRAAKIGIPAGVFSSMPLSDKVEAYYHPTASKSLFREALNNCVKFFNGNDFDDKIDGIGLDDYLDYLREVRGGNDLTELINNQFQVCVEKSDLLQSSLKEQVERDNMKMLELHDALQENVVLMKVDMLQALNIKVDFVDADGD